MKRSKVVPSRNQPMRPERTMTQWFKDNVLALLLVSASVVGTYTIAADRITTLEVKLVSIIDTVEQQVKRAEKTDNVIENNTKALNKIAVLFARVDGKLDTFDLRIKHLEDRDERLTGTSLERAVGRTTLERTSGQKGTRRLAFSSASQR